MHISIYIIIIILKRESKTLYFYFMKIMLAEEFKGGLS